MTSKFLIPKIAKYDSGSESSSNESVHPGPTPGRKRKLDHLSMDEKVQRKKLKNRVAAQTSRDRKKKQMEEMQDTIEHQGLQIVNLERRCDQLANERDKMVAKYEKLEREYQKMKARNTSRKPETGHNIPEEHKYTRLASDEMSVDSCVGSFTIKTEGSAEGYKNGNRVNKALNKVTQPNEERSVGIAESHHALPSLQELLQDIEFDQFDLEQLAESLLDDVSSNLETNVLQGSATNAKVEGYKQPMPEPMVGTDNKAMEPTKNSGSVRSEPIIDDVKLINEETYNKNRSTIYYADEIPVEEESLEIHDSPEIYITFKTELMDGLLSPIPSYEEENIKSPLHSISDCGYESHGSPLSLNEFRLNEQDDLNFLLNDLFPALA